MVRNLSAKLLLMLTDYIQLSSTVRRKANTRAAPDFEINGTELLTRLTSIVLTAMFCNMPLC